jgi:hypothetical protein
MDDPYMVIGILVVAATVWYFLPTIIAVRRRHRNRMGIFILDLFLGWTLVGWVTALIWAIYNERPRRAEVA